MIKFSVARLEKEPIELTGSEPAEFLEIEPGEEFAKCVEAKKMRRIGRLVGRSVRERDPQHDEEGRQEEGEQPEIGDRGDEQPAPAGGSGNRAAHESSTMPASTSQDSQTLSSQAKGRSMRRVRLVSETLSNLPSSPPTITWIMVMSPR